MANHVFMVPGYAVRVGAAGPDFLRNVDGRAWTDQQGAPSGSGITFRGVGGTDNWFHFPITNPTILNDKRLKCNLVAVTLALEPSNAFLRIVMVFDRTNNFFSQAAMNVNEDLSNQWVEGKNQFTFPDKEVQGAIGISVNIFFDQDANVTFTGAAARFHD
jgi:hypothetical protein